MKVQTVTVAVAQSTEEERDWLAVQFAAVAGLRLSIVHEFEGVIFDRAAKRDDRVAEREARLINLRRALDRAQRWAPLSGELPRRIP